MPKEDRNVGEALASPLKLSLLADNSSNNDHDMISRASSPRLIRLAGRLPFICQPCRRFASAVHSDHVNIIEMGPRDGLQNEKKAIPLATKLELIQRLARTGIRTIEAGSFVSPKWVPQVCDIMPPRAGRY